MAYKKNLATAASWLLVASGLLVGTSLFGYGADTLLGAGSTLSKVASGLVGASAVYAIIQKFK